MARRRNKRTLAVRTVAVAAPPGSLNSPAGSLTATVSVIAYGPEGMVERDLTDFGDLDQLSDYPTRWVNVVGLGSVDVLVDLGHRFNLHRLSLEDVLHVPQRPKLDDFGDHQYIVARMPIAAKHLETEQLSIFLGKSYVVTVQEQPGDVFETIRRRIREGRPRIRGGGPGYLTYAILDALVDSYFPLLEHVGTELEALETEILDNVGERHTERLHALKHDMVTLRRYLWPLRELNSTLIRPDVEFLGEEVRLYMRDCYDHSVHALDLVDSYRDIASGLMDLYLSMVSQRTNDVMKVLTIIATIFIPLSFFAGLYGMNFNPESSRWSMPELDWPYAYPVLLGLMALCAGGMLVFFWRRGWFR